MADLGLENYFPCNSSFLFKYKKKDAVKDYEEGNRWKILKCLTSSSETGKDAAAAKVEVEEEGGKGDGKGKGKGKGKRKRKAKLKSKKERKEERERREEGERIPAGLDPENVKELGLRIKVGKKVNVESLLKSRSRSRSKGERDYLVDCKGNEVKVSRVLEEGKHILIRHFELPVCSYLYHGVVCWLLQRAIPKWSDHFQLVVVATFARPNPCPNLRAETLLSMFLDGLSCDSHTCLAIPISDPASCRRVRGFLRDCSPFGGSLLLDPNGVVLHMSDRCMMELGAPYFPFSQLHTQYDALQDSIYSLLTQRPVPLESLLGVGLDYSLSNSAGTRTILVSHLKPKLVGLYLCQTGQFMHFVQGASQHCRENDRDLQIVLVYNPLTDHPRHLISCANAALSETPPALQENWWLLPFDDSTSRRLWNLCKRSSRDEFIIVGPHGQFMDPKALNLIRSPSSLQNMYPYAAEHIARQETDRLTQLTFESLLSASPYKYLTSAAAADNAAQLDGKIVCLFLANCGDANSSDKALKSMAAWCRDRQCQDAAKNYPNFALVFVPFYHHSKNNKNLDFTPHSESDPRMSWLWDPSMAWLICRPTHACQDSIIQHATLKGLPFNLNPWNPLKYIIFGEDGKLVSIGIPLLSEIQADGGFLPDQLYEEVLAHYCLHFNYDDHSGY